MISSEEFNERRKYVVDKKEQNKKKKIEKEKKKLLKIFIKEQNKFLHGEINFTRIYFSKYDDETKLELFKFLVSLAKKYQIGLAYNMTTPWKEATKNNIKNECFKYVDIQWYRFNDDPKVADWILAIPEYGSETDIVSTYRSNVEIVNYEPGLFERFLLFVFNRYLTRS
jgi:hypothetical protein